MRRYVLPRLRHIDVEGNVTFTRPDRLFTVSVIDPIVTVDADGGAIVNVRATLVSDLPGVPSRDERADISEFALTSPIEETATTVNWELGNGAVTSEAAAALVSFLTAGAAPDPIHRPATRRSAGAGDDTGAHADRDT